MQVTKYIPKEYPTKYEDFKHTLSIGELNKDPEMSLHSAAEIIRTIKKWLKINIKAENICNDDAIDLIVDHIYESCSNLELQEINFIFKEGIKGAFGVIYSHIGIDTICGKDGWIESYYKEYRTKRKEPKQREIEDKLTGSEITLDEFHSRNPEYKGKFQLSEIVTKAKNFKIKLDDVKNFYKLKGLTLNDFKDDQQIYSYNYWNFHKGKGYTEMQYILEQHRNFILENYLKKSN